MNYNKNRPEQTYNLRRQAERIFRGNLLQSPENLESLSPEETRRMIHELREHQIELERQTEDLSQALEAERESGKCFRLMFKNAPLPYQSLDENGNFIEVNQTFIDALGYTQEELIGRNFGDLLHPDWVDHFKENFPRFKAIGEVLGVEFEMVKKNKSTILVSFNGKIQRDDQGYFQRTHCIFHDISERKRAEEVLQESEQSFRTLADSGRALIWTSGADKLCNYFNRVWLEFTGRTLEQEIGNGWTEGVHPDDLQHCLNIYVGAFDRREKFSMEYRLRRFDGGYRWILDDGCPRYNSKNEFIGYIGHCLDISERKLAEDALRKSEATLNLLLETIPIPVFYKDREGRYLGFNKAFEVFLGKNKEQLIGKSVFDINPPELAKVYHARDVELFEKPGVQIYDSQVRDAHGVLHNVIFHKALLTDTQGSVTGLIGAILDITERKQAEETLREREEKYRNLFNNAEVGIFRSRLDGSEVMEINRRFLDIVGMTLDETLGKPSVNLWADPKEREEMVKRLVADGSVSGFEYKMRNKRHGDVRNCLTSLRLYQEQGILEGSILDITERKWAEEKNAKLEAQLQQAQKMESVGRLAGGVAHDFNNMLSAILGHTEMAMMRCTPSEPLHADLQEIQKAAERSADLTRQLLAFARKQTIAPKVLGLNETIESMLKMLRRLIGEDIDLAWLPGKKLWQVKVDPSQIDQILANLCVNARDAIAGVGKVTIETKDTVFDEAYCAQHMGVTPGEYVELTVSDDGCGMDKEILDKLFEPFFTTKEIGKGTGLGLATIYGIIKQNKGFINVYSEPGQGTTFTIYLPRHAGKAALLQKEVSVDASERGQETILLVEDEPAILKMTTKMLEMQGYTVLAASTPGEAIRLAEAHGSEIHLIMTDVIMPEMNGRDLVNNLLSIYPNLKHLFMSGYTANVIAHHGVLDPEVKFIQKPFSIKNLAAKIREALE